MSIKYDHSYFWSNGSLEFESDIEMRSYYDEHGVSESGEEFVRVQKITVTNEE